MLRRSSGQRHLATVLFTDIVGSTERAAGLGDRRWRHVIAEHHALLRRALRRHGGHEVDTAGDGFFATFPAPAAAVECARDAIVEIRTRLGIDIRAGVHTGEVERHGAKVGGIAVHIGARVLSLAGPGDVVITSTVRDLVGGSDLRFVDRGTHQLKGVPEPWHLYALELVPAEAASALGEGAHVPARVAHRPVAVAALLGALAVGGVAVLGSALLLDRVTGEPSPPQAAGPNAAIALARDGTRVGGQSIGTSPNEIVVGGGSVWVASVASSTVTRLEPSGGSQLTIGGVGRPTALAFDADAQRLWVLDGLGGRVSVVDARNGQLLDSFRQAGRGIAVGSGAVWIADEVNESVVVLDPTSRRVSATIPFEPGSRPVAVAVGGGAVWVAAKGSMTVERINPATRTLLDSSTSVSGGPTDIAAGSSIWVASAQSDALIRLDPADGRVGRTYSAVCNEPGGVVAAGDGAWLTCRQDGTVLRVGPDGVDATIEVGYIPNDVALEGDRAWVTLAAE